MKRLEVHSSYACSNKCRFCSEADQLSIFRNYHVPYATIAPLLLRYAYNGYVHVTFTGGEPSFHPDIIALLRNAKDAGFITFLTTNGGLFHSLKFCNMLLPFLDEICFSVHGHTQALHEYHTQKKRSFSLVHSALRNVDSSRHATAIFINTVVTRYNIPYLPQLFDSLRRYKKIKQLLFSAVAPEGRAVRQYKKLAARASCIARQIPQLYKQGQEAGRLIRVFGIPLCVFGDFEDSSNDVHWTPRTTIEIVKRGRGAVIKTTRSFKPVRNRVKAPQCRACCKSNICGGIFKAYYEIFGAKEFNSQNK